MVHLQSVNGGKLHVHGCINLAFKIGKTEMQHRFYVVNKISRNVIIGRDFLYDKNVRLYFDKQCLRINNDYIKLENDYAISSLIRLKQDTYLPAYTSTLCTGKIKSHFPKDKSKSFMVQQVQSGLIHSDPHLTVTESLISLATNTCPLLINNMSGKSIKLRQGTVIAQIIQTDKINIASVNSVSISSEKITPSTEPVKDSEINVDPQYLPIISDLINEYRDLFIDNDCELGAIKGMKVHIDTGDSPPIRLRPYRCPLNTRKYIESAVKEMLEAGVIRESNSSYAFPVVLADKRTEPGSDKTTKRFCVDFRKLNSVIKPMSFPMPLPDDIINQMTGCKFFTCLDLRSAFWQLELDEESTKKTAFVTHVGHHEFLKMPFGVSLGSQIFQSCIQKVLKGCESFSGPFVDDVSIYSKSADEHFKHIRAVFDKFREFNVKLKLKKCQFMKRETSYLGFHLSEHGVKPDPHKVEAIRQVPTPSNLREVRGFIGATSFFRRFYTNYTQLAKPLWFTCQCYHNALWPAY